ncbi:MAG: transcriptional regulator GcvA [Pseudorhodoplanes sp.]|uniref:transcriptional regulator GcvA n=1 Tax=Pseudorhodoplanes sp. TaxID=1934341 RepID=UPI003D0FE7D5
MKRRIPPLNPLRAFEAAARHLSFTKAADELNVTQGAVSRQVKVLEDYLGFGLFERTSKGLELSRNGRAYVGSLSQAFEQIARATDEVVSSRSQSILTIRGYTTFLVRWLIPLLPEFKMKHPNVEIRLVSAADPVDFERDNVDLGIRYGFGQWRNIESDLLFLDSLRPVCSPSLLEHVRLKTPNDLARCTLLHLNQRRSDWPDWLVGAGCESLIAENNLFLEDLGVVYQCAVAGMGVAIGQQAYIEDDLAARRLVVPFEVVLRRPKGYFLVCPKDRAHAAKIRIFRDWLRERLANDALVAAQRSDSRFACDLMMTAGKRTSNRAEASGFVRNR